MNKELTFRNGSSVLRFEAHRDFENGVVQLIIMFDDGVKSPLFSVVPLEDTLKISEFLYNNFGVLDDWAG